MRYISLLFLVTFFSFQYVKSQNPLDDIEFPKEKWERDPAATVTDNLKNCLAHLVNEAKQEPYLKFLEMHFSSIQMLVDAYPQEESILEGLLSAYENPYEAGGLNKYRMGAKQLLLAYEAVTGDVSYVAVTLPEYYDPRITYPLYVWGTEGYGDIIKVPEKLKEQISGGLLWRAPSSRFKDGYSIVPYGLGQVSYTGNCAEDFLDGIDLVIDNFKTDKSKYYMGGFSNGAKATYNISTYTGVMEKYQFAGLAFWETALYNNEINESSIQALSDVAIWLGYAESSSLKSISEFFKKELEEIGNAPKVFTSYPVNHTWTQQTQGDIALFLQQQQRLMPGDAPSKPSGLSEVESTESSAKISWEDNADNELLFVVERKGENDESFKEIAKVAPDEAFFVDKTAIQGNTYDYRVYAYNSSGQSEPSNEITVTLPGVKIVNLALNKSVSDNNETSDENCQKLVDGHTTGIDRYRWNANPMPVWAEIYLGDVYDIKFFKLYAYDNREYLYTIEVKESRSDEYKTVVEKTFNVSAPVYIDSVDVKAKYVRLNINSALIYTGKAANISEFEVYGVQDIQSGIEGITEESNICVYPNPVNDGEFTVLTNSNQPVTIDIMSLEGKLIRREVSTYAETKIRTNAIKPGMYLISVQTNMGTQTKKIFIEQ